MHWILEDGKPKRVSSDVWARWFEEDANRQIAYDEFDNIYVSTIFLGIDHRFGEEGPPLIFETMTFGGPTDMAQRRYSTLDEALVGHQAMVKEAKGE